MSDTGGGHRASAQALRDAFDELEGKGVVETEIVDVFTTYCKAWPYRDFVPIYKFLATAPALWAFVWFGTAVSYPQTITQDKEFSDRLIKMRVKL